MKKVFYIVLIIALLLGISCASMAMTHYEKVDTPTGLVTADALNVRQGPGTNFKIVTVVYKNEYIRLFAKVGDWYIVQTDRDYIGAVSGKYIKLIYPTTTQNNEPKEPVRTETNGSLTADEQEVFDLINTKRTESGLPGLKIDEEVQRVARIKAQDMVDNNYFSHNSPTYGTPFNMLKSFKVSYKSAGENIAGNSTNTGAVNAWMNSEGHKANILNNSYNYTGIGVVSSPKYGKIYVQMFIGK